MTTDTPKQENDTYEEISELDTLEIVSPYWDASNVLEFKRYKVARKDGKVGFMRKTKFQTKEGKEVYDQSPYIYLEFDGIVKPTKMNNKSLTEIKTVLHTTKPNDLIGKELIPVFDMFGTSRYVIWKPQPTFDNATKK